ncbi:hypothetical protein RJ55_03192 [Drechmeria coniospora]|nr:hypothetical protein RJ55_03192 [Drechmeria coniospora]
MRRLQLLQFHFHQPSIHVAISLTLLQMDDDQSVEDAVARLLASVQDDNKFENERVGSMPETSLDYVRTNDGAVDETWLDSSHETPVTSAPNLTPIDGDGNGNGNGDATGTLSDSTPERIPSRPSELSTGPPVEVEQPQSQALHRPPDSPVGRRIEVAIPDIPIEVRNEYVALTSEVVEHVAEMVPGSGEMQYVVEFTDGRRDLISVEELAVLENGVPALRQYKRNKMGGRKRKYGPDDEWDSDVEHADTDPMELDPDESSQSVTRPGRKLRVRESILQSHSSDDDDSDIVKSTSTRPPSTRNLRQRQPHQPNMYTISVKSGADLDDELATEPQQPSEGDDDEFQPVVSDIGITKGRRRNALQRARRMRAQPSRTRGHPRVTQAGAFADSDIEFEQPRRSSRATRNMVDMRDDALMDDDSFYLIDDRAQPAPKFASVREIFQPLPAESAFGTVHMGTCHTCGGSKHRGQLVHCQGCSLSYHKHCLGVRSVRDHLVTKIADDSFVLQCKFCINIHRKRDRNAPNGSRCQTCEAEGDACAPFSQRKTATQEEKLRVENGGTDPISPVSPALVNNEDVLLFRCVACHRGWHLDHLPRTGSEPIGTDVKAERLKDYMIDWQCNECSTQKHKIQRLVAWRPSQGVTDDAPRPAFESLTDDAKEYLVKWDTLSYFHCTWMPGPWIFGTTTAAMRTTFNKKAVQQDLLKLTDKEAIPDEYLIPDIIFNVRLNSTGSRAKPKEAELADVGNVGKVLVKFQGLGYDDVVWDEPPIKDMEELYDAFRDAYREYVQGRQFQHEATAKIRDRIRAFKAADFVEVTSQPGGLKRGKLMGYQIEGLNWLLSSYHAGRNVVLADEMGLGKTVQVVSLVTSLVQDKPKCWPFLIVVPNATCPNWRREFKQWAPDLRVVTYHGGRESQELAYKYELFPDESVDMKAHVVIMSYDSAQDPKTRVLFKSVHWAGLVVDEGQRLKNDRNLLYLALRSMKIPFRLLLTGTPLQNNKRELFNLLQFIDDRQDAAALDMEYAVLDKETLPKLHEKIRPYFLRRTKAGVLKFLPPMAQIILPVSMTVIQEKLAKSIMAKNPQLIKAMFANGKMKSKDRSTLNNILIQLRKCFCHPFMYSEAIEERHHDPSVLHQNLVEASSKLLLLSIMLPKLKERGNRVLIFSQFLHQLDIMEDFLSGLGYQFRRLDGAMSSLEKQRRIDAFNAPDSPIFVFLLSTRAGGVGINLATADTVIIMDPDFNPHQDIQALSRAHRIGQKQKVLCFQLVTKDTVEERIMQVGRKKMALDHALIESMDDEEIAGDDLESILKHGAQALFSDDYQKTAIHYDGPSVDKLLDRSQMEQTKADEEGSAETQFTYARVWANEKQAFTEGLDMAEAEAPEPISSSVWDKILAQREEEARLEAEANREVLGRGGRRRNTINYKTSSTLENAAFLEGAVPDSDSSDEFAGGESADDSEDDDSAKKAEEQTEGATTSRQPNAVGQRQVDTSKGEPGQAKSRRSKSKPKPKSGPRPGETPARPSNAQEQEGPASFDARRHAAYNAAQGHAAFAYPPQAASSQASSIKAQFLHGPAPPPDGLTGWRPPGRPPNRPTNRQAIGAVFPAAPAVPVVNFGGNASGKGIAGSIPDGLPYYDDNVGRFPQHFSHEGEGRGGGQKRPFQGMTDPNVLYGDGTQPHAALSQPQPQPPPMLSYPTPHHPAPHSHPARRSLPAIFSPPIPPTSPGLSSPSAHQPGTWLRVGMRNGKPFLNSNGDFTEAQLRLAIDEVRHSTKSQEFKQQLLHFLLQQLRGIRTPQNGTKKS